MSGVNYFVDGKIIAEYNEAKVYKMDGELYLEIGPGHNLWAYEGEFEELVTQISDYPKGNCLEIGLGLGLTSRYLLTFPKVKQLTTVEINKDVIELHKRIREEDRKYSLDYDPSRHNIVHSDGLNYAYLTKNKFDFIFIDCYEVIDEDTLPMIADVTYACSRLRNKGGKIIGWLDVYTPEPFYSSFIELFNSY